MTSPFGGLFDAKCSFFWLLRDRFCDVAVWGGGRGKKNEQNHRDAVLKRIGATWSCVDRIFFRLIAVI